MLILFFKHLIDSLMSMLIVLISINVFEIENALLLIIKSIKLLISCIHFIFVIFRRSYDCRRFIMFIMKRFFCVVSSLTKQSYNDFELMQYIKDMKRSRIADNVVLKATSRSKSWVNAYNLAARTLRVTRLLRLRLEYKYVTFSLRIVFLWTSKLA
jgi:hypothetical protein